MAEPAAGNARETLHLPRTDLQKAGFPLPEAKGSRRGTPKKGGGYLLSRIAAQYHRRGWA